MTSREKIAFKSKLKNFGLGMLRQRIGTAQEDMNRAQEAANSEEKSSAGDKYETGRAMVEGQVILFVSPMAPLARLLQNKKEGDVILFNGLSMVIEDVY
jgi:hypothetical protein